MKNFNDIYEEIYKSSGKELIKLKKQITIRNVLLILLVIIFGTIGIITGSLAILITIVVVVLIVIFIFAHQVSAYKAKYKEEVIKKFVKEYSENLDYYPQRGMGPREYDGAGFDGYYDRYHSEDLIEGKILDDCNIKMAEIHTEREDTTTDSEGNVSTSYVTIFRGLFAKVDLSKNSNLDFRVIRNGLFKGKQRLEMDSGEFEKIYDVMTEDKIGTLRVLTSDVMQTLIDFKEKNKVAPEIALINNVLYIRFAVGNVFEPNMFKSDMDFDSLKRNYDMINFVFNLTKDISNHILEYDE